MNPAKTPNGGRPHGRQCQERQQDGEFRHRRGKPADGSRVHVVPVPRTNDPARQAGVHSLQAPRSPERQLPEGVTAREASHKPPEHGEERGCR